MEQVLLVIQVIIAAALIGMVLIQRSETDGFGLGSGGGSGLISGRAKANLLTRTTAIIAGLFIINSLILSIIAAHKHAPSIVDEIDKDQAAVAAPVVAGKDKKDVKAVVVKKTGAPAVPNADEVKSGTKEEVPAKTTVETKPAPKAAKKVKAAVDADANLDTTGGDKSE